MLENERPGGTGTAPDKAGQSLWRAVPDAIRGSREDYTRIPLPRAIVLLAIPMMLELVMESTFGLVDIYFVGKLGPPAIAAVGLTGSVIIMVFAIVMGLSMGTTATVARRIGEGDPEAAGLAAWQAILAGVMGSAPVSLAGYLLAPALLRWMGASPEIEAGYQYTAVLFAGSVTIFLLFLNNAIFRGSGDAVTAMRALWLANLLNIVLDPLLIFGIGPFPELGLMGAALATTLGRGLGVVYQLAVLFGGRGKVSISRASMRWDGPVFWSLLRISITGMVQFFIATAAWLGLTRIIALFGGTVLAGYTLALRLIHVAILPSWGVSNATATLVGQNLGAMRPERAERAVISTGFVNFAMLSVISLAFWQFAEPLVKVFTADAEVVSNGVQKPEDPQRRVYLRRLLDGIRPSIQRRGRYRHARLGELPVLLVLAAAARLCSREAVRIRRSRGVRRRRHFRCHLGHHRLHLVPSRQLEETQGLDAFLRHRTMRFRFALTVLLAASALRSAAGSELQWTELPPPQARSLARGAFVAEVGGRLVVAGGILDDGGPAIRDAWILDSSEASWRETTPLPEPASLGAVAVHGESAFLRRQLYFK